LICFEEIEDGIFLLKTPFSTLWTGVTLIKRDRNYLIDSGADSPEEYIIPALKNLGMDISDVDYLLNTHCHGDHITGHFDLVNKYGIKTVTYSKGADKLLNPAENAVRIRTKFPKDSPKPQGWLKGVRADVTVEDGDVFDDNLILLHTPGHDDDCVCWYDIKTKTAICGDSLQGNGTPTQGIGFYSNMSDYTKTLDRLSETDINRLVLGHYYDGIGDVIAGKENVRQAIEACRGYVAKYSDYIRGCFENGERDYRRIAIDMIRDIGCGMPEYLFLALYTITEHIKAITVIERT